MDNKRIIANIATTERIYDYIATHNLAAGDRLPPERELASLFKVSRSNIRETLIMLETKDLLVRKHGSGIYLKTVDKYLWANNATGNVSSVSNQELLKILKEMIELRVLLETHGFCNVAQTITESQIAELRGFNEKQYLSLTNSTSPVNPGLNFEEKVLELGSNRIILSTYRQVNIAWKNYMSAINSVAISASDRYLDHNEMIEALASKNANHIARSIKKHHRKNLSNLEVLLKLQEKHTEEGR